jgi:hypothetical protein
VPGEHLPDRRARPAQEPAQSPWSEVRLAAGTEDRFFLLGRQLPRAVAGSARAVVEGALLATACQPTLPPAVSRGRRDVEGGGGRSQRASAFDLQDERVARRRSELGVSVQVHLALLWPWSSSTHSLQGGPDAFVSRSQRVWADQLADDDSEPAGHASTRCDRHFHGAAKPLSPRMTR